MKENKGSNIIIVFISLYLITPIAFTFLYSIFTEWNDVLPRGLTFRYYIQIFTDMSFIMSILSTILITIIPVIICTVAVLLAMYVVVVYVPQLDKYIQVLCTIPYAIQGVIIAISVLSLYANAPWPFSNRFIMLTATYCIVILPYIYMGIKNSLNTVNASRLIEAAQVLGAVNCTLFLQ